MTDEIPSALLNATNQRVLAYLQNLSAHDEAGSALREALKPLGAVQLFCPDWASYRYVVASTQNLIFGVALGMNTIGFRLSPHFKSRALQTGGEAFPELGPEWVQFVSKSDWPALDLRFWALKAYMNVREQ